MVFARHPAKLLYGYLLVTDVMLTEQLLQFLEQWPGQSPLYEKRLDFFSAIDGFHDCTDTIHVLIGFPLFGSSPPLPMLHMLLFAGEVTHSCHELQFSTQSVTAPVVHR